METADCEVRLLGDLNNSVPKQNVTPAEALIIRTIHGPDSIIKLKITGSDKRPHKEEHARLELIYGQSVSDNGTFIFSKLFPQQFDPKLPVKFSEIGIEVDESSGGESFVPDIPDEADETIDKQEDTEKEALQKKRGK